MISDFRKQSKILICFILLSHNIIAICLPKSSMWLFFPLDNVQSCFFKFHFSKSFLLPFRKHLTPVWVSFLLSSEYSIIHIVVFVYSTEAKTIALSGSKITITLFCGPFYLQIVGEHGWA